MASFSKLAVEAAPVLTVGAEAEVLAVETGETAPRGRDVGDFGEAANLAGAEATGDFALDFVGDLAGAGAGAGVCAAIEAEVNNTKAKAKQRSALNLAILLVSCCCGLVL